MEQSLLKNKREAGFSLLEVLIALAIISIALSALLLATSRAIQATSALRERTFSAFVSQNALNLVLLNLAPTSSTQEAKLFNQTWYWKAEVDSTNLPKIERITVKAHLANKPAIGPGVSGYRRARRD